MAFDDLFRLSAHAVIFNENQRLLLLKANYGNKAWGLPGGALEPGETIHEAVTRECSEELGVIPEIECLTGVYYHTAYNSQVFLFRASLPDDVRVSLSSEHSEYAYFQLDDLSDIQRQRVQDTLDFSGVVFSRRF